LYTESGSVTVGSTPAAPARVTAWKQGSGIQVLWDPVSMPAGVTFEHYQIQFREVGTNEWSTPFVTDAFNTETLPRSNFARGRTYQFRVAAVANTGVGAYRISNSVRY